LQAEVRVCLDCGKRYRQTNSWQKYWGDPRRCLGCDLQERSNRLRTQRERQPREETE
jgi:hypothetical protein